MTPAGEAWMEFFLHYPNSGFGLGGSSIEDGGRFVVAGTIKGESGGSASGVAAAPGAASFDSHL